MEEGVAEVLAEEHMGPWIRNVATKTDVAMIRKDLENAEANLRGDVATKPDAAMIRRDSEHTQAMIQADSEHTQAMIRKDLEHTLAMIRADAEKRIAEIRADLIKWMFGAVMVQGALVVALIKLFS